jgi:pimeloyl-ACP methyl ester carboxylesterase
MSVTWTDQSLDVAGVKLHLSRAGAGPKLLFLHHDIGTLDRLPIYDELAGHFDVLVPHHPGWGQSTDRPAWLRHPRDIAAIYAWMLADLRATDVSLVGCGFGGWIAAEMASQAPTAYAKLVLAGAMGIKPNDGYILDQAIVSYIDYARAGFHDPAAFARVFGDVTTDQLEQWDICREMCFRTAWKPYMYSQTLPHLLGGVRTPALVVWGDDDKVVPIVVQDQYVAALKTARKAVVANSGHCIDMEQPAAFAALITPFVNS